MKHNSSNRRSRSRGNKQRHSGGRNNYESNGPGGKVRGTVQQVLDKYLALARDAQSSGDRIGAESFFQFAEHYFRVLNVEGGNGQGRRDRSNQVSEDPSMSNVESNTLGNAAENLQTNTNESAEDILDVSGVDLVDQTEPEVSSDLAETVIPTIDLAPSAEVEDSSEPDVLEGRQKEADSSLEEVDVPTAS